MEKQNEGMRELIHEEIKKAVDSGLITWTEFAQYLTERLTEQGYSKQNDTAKEIFAAVDKIINKHHSECYEYEDGDECDTAITYLSYVSADINELKKKYLEANDAESN